MVQEAMILSTGAVTNVAAALHILCVDKTTFTSCGVGCLTTKREVRVRTRVMYFHVRINS